ncbi:MAG: nicotinate-nucleotide--dimethylbenzimidazole phosphoribosyltransferase [Thermodesulfobacteriota bacterium]|nr:nicotinate-nucleotide--dimethylbenzimidazole phosphoribosyltransferase [Thermodesulfobacteriota bacterium]
MRKILENTLAAISPVDKTLAKAALVRLDNLTKPKASLGRLEHLAVKVYCIQNGNKPAVDPARIYTCAADHGVVDQGVSLYPREVTRQMVFNFLNQGAAVSVLAKTCGLELKVVDAGCLGPEFDPHPNLVRQKIAPGTFDFTLGPAMTEEQCLQALCLGIDLAGQAKERGIRALGLGDMGIGNTSASTALYCAYFNLAPETMAGPGTGLDGAGVARKIKIIEKGLETNAEAVRSANPIRILAALGGFEIACLAGLALGGARHGLVMVVDGFISTAAFASAWKLCPDIMDYAVFAHVSGEPGHQKALELMHAHPLLDLGMRLGEGTGAALGLFLLRAAVNVFNDMASFGEAGVSRV